METQNIAEQSIRPIHTEPFRPASLCPAYEFFRFRCDFFRERSNLEQNDYRAALRRGILWRKRNMQGYRLCGQHGTRNAFRQRPRTPPAIFGPYDRNRRKGGIAEGVVAAAERQTGLHNDRPHASGRRRNVRKDRLAPGLRSEIRPRIRLEPLQTRGA